LHGVVGRCRRQLLNLLNGGQSVVFQVELVIQVGDCDAASSQSAAAASSSFMMNLKSKRASHVSADDCIDDAIK